MSNQGFAGADQVAGVGMAGRAATNVPLSCAACHALAVLSPAAKGFRCRSCGAQNTFYECQHCHAASVAAAPHGQPTTKWSCQSCHRTSQMPLFGRMPVQTARDVLATNELNGVDPLGRRRATLGGFVTVSSTRPTLLLGSTCTVGMLDGGVSVRVADGTSGELFAYEDLAVLEISGRGPERAGGTEPRGGGSLATRLGTVQKPGVDTVMRLATARDAVVLRHPKHTREQLRRAFAEMLVNWQAAHRPMEAAPAVSFDAALAELERLRALHANGGISDAEFEAMRAPIVRRLSDR